MNTRTPKSATLHESSPERSHERARQPRDARTRHEAPTREPDELALAALSAPFPPEPSASELGLAEPTRERPPPRDGVEPEDADDFSGEAPTTVRAPASGVVARHPAAAALLTAPLPVEAPSERALARVALIIMGAGPGELIVPLPPYPQGPSMILLTGLGRLRTGGSGAPRVAASGGVAGDVSGKLFELTPVGGFAAPATGPDVRAAAPARDPARSETAFDSTGDESAPELGSTPALGFAQGGVAPSRETLPPRRGRRTWALGVAALALVGTTGLIARAGLLRGLHAGFDSASSAALDLEQRAQRALARPVASMLPSVMPAEPSAPEPTLEDLVERAKRLINAGGAPRLREAQTLLEEARAADSQNPHVRATLGEVLLQRGAYEAAFTEAAEAVRLRPRRARYRVLLGDVYHALGRADEAEKAYTKAAELDPHGRSVDDVDGSSVRALSEL